LISTVEWDQRKDIESGFLYAARFTKPMPQMIIAGGAGNNDLKIFENNVDSTA
jgi:hypothetical protein